MKKLTFKYGYEATCLVGALLFAAASCGPLKPEPKSVEQQIDEQQFCYLYVPEHAGYGTRESCHEGPIECEDAKHFAERRFDVRVVSDCFREPND